MPFPNRMPQTPASPLVQNQVTAQTSLDQDVEQAEYQRLKDIVTKLADTWNQELTETTTRRNLRYMPLDMQRERQLGNLKADEIITPLRVINDNINKEQAQFISYLTTSRNAAIFKLKSQLPPDAEKPDAQPLEEWFTGLVRYPGWELPYFQAIDGTQTHGTDFVEVSYDKEKPGFFSMEQLAHENVWFPQDCENLQKATVVIRNCKVTKEDMLKWPGVNTQQVDLLFQEQANIGEVKSLEDVQKVFYRPKDKDGVVYVCWMHYRKCNDFIRPPQPLFIGRVKAKVSAPLPAQLGMAPQQQPQITFDQVFETLYPIECFPYITSENKRLRDVKGRVFFDEYIQEAVTSLMSSIINGWHRSSQVYGSLEAPASGGTPEQLMTLQAGKIYSQKINFFHMDPPDAEGMNIINGLLTQNKAETGQINFAVGNRNDYASRKTAQEIKSAEQQTALLGAVQVTLFSIFMRNVLTRKWGIAQSQAVQGLIPVPDKVKPLLQYEWEVYSAGDVEVIKRAETIQKMMQAWSVIANTPAANVFLEDLLVLMFPQNGSKYVDAIRQMDPKKLIAALAMILEAIAQQHPEVIPPEQQQQVGQLLNAANQVSGMQQQGHQGQTNESTGTSSHQDSGGLQEAV